jgi:hypothetical protein
VSWELESGVRALMNLIKMVGEAIEGQKEPRRTAVGSDWIGFYVRGSKGWVGVRFTNPAKLYFHTYQIAVDATVTEQLGGIVKETSDSPNRLRWQLELQLDSEEVHFFARSRASQMQEIEKFVKRGFDGLDRILKIAAASA